VVVGNALGLWRGSGSTVARKAISRASAGRCCEGRISSYRVRMEALVGPENGTRIPRMGNRT
jgi:hypothetical protein